MREIVTLEYAACIDPVDSVYNCTGCDNQSLKFLFWVYDAMHIVQSARKLIKESS